MTNMTTRLENPQKDSWWISELDSLGVSVRVRNELNDIQETSNLAENLKHVFYQAYKDAYNNDNNQISSHIQMALTLLLLFYNSLHI